MDFTIQQDRAELKAAYELQLHSELTSVRLVECRMSGLTVEISGDSGFRLEMRRHSAKLESPPDQLRIAVSLEFEASQSAEPAGKLFEIDCTFELRYLLTDGFCPDDGQIHTFKDGNAVFNCWPYAREFVQSMAVRMGLQVPPLPLLRVLSKSGNQQADTGGEPKKRPVRRKSNAKDNAAQ